MPKVIPGLIAVALGAAAIAACADDPGRPVATTSTAVTSAAAPTVSRAPAPVPIRIPDGTSSLFTGVDVATVPTDPDDRPVELGLRFTARADGTIYGIRFLRAAGDTAAHPVTVWTGAGRWLAGAASPAGKDGTWQLVPLPAPVRAKAGQEYVVSYHTTRYRATHDFFPNPIRTGSLSTTGIAGVYVYGPGAFPTKTYLNSNYWVDVAFGPDQIDEKSSYHTDGVAR